ncbi:tryptophan synthase subunit alpha [Rathayibacter tritici]|uniref:tryptophan synthase subunit alpha n=1 Tax=Rathayibacter tritici TaxID=33888 RepID=UPI000CE88994|nr:tryptophan synthase subunit alpha [Rathayibacter tritici]PPF66083.1 tryptophan synthase subunit alpha [Rathayibacter tritici]PPG06652.1 tryptophan synthase subunit alpha [Rathayibacter tritici]
MHDTGAVALAPRPFFTSSWPGTKPGLALFVNSGDPSDDELVEIVRAMDEAGVGCVELAVPFPDSITDGPVIRRSARRALDRGADLPASLALVSRLRAETSDIRIALLVDWSHSLKRLDLGEVLSDIAQAGADAVLVHGLPPALRTDYLAAAERAALPVISTCYHGTSSDETVATAARDASAYVYLVARYGRSGSPSTDAFDSIGGTIAALRAHTTVPVTIGFGISTAADVRRVGEVGADAAIVGTAGVRAIEEGLAEGDVVASFRSFLDGLVR